MAIPTRYRALLEDICSNDLVITIDMKSTCLTLSPLPEWKKFEEKVSALPAMDELGEMLSRFVVGQAKDLQVDGSGRILIYVFQYPTWYPTQFQFIMFKAE